LSGFPDERTNFDLKGKDFLLNPTNFDLKGKDFFLNPTDFDLKGKDFQIGPLKLFLVAEASRSRVRILEAQPRSPLGSSGRAVPFRTSGGAAAKEIGGVTVRQSLSYIGRRSRKRFKAEMVRESPGQAKISF
jgi:hypothetical protein